MMMVTEYYNYIVFIFLYIHILGNIHHLMVI